MRVLAAVTGMGATDTQCRLIELLEAFLRAEQRAEVASELAAVVGAEQLMLFVHDPELGVPVPASGLPQRLPQGGQWQPFIRRCVETGEATGELVSPYDGRRLRCVARTGRGDDPRCLLVVLGGDPDPVRLEVLLALLPLAAFALTQEQLAQVARAAAALETDTAREAKAMTSALDAARRRLQETLAVANRTREELERALHLRDQFLGAASHELRNPLHALLLTLGGLRRALEGGSQPDLDPGLFGERLDKATEQCRRLDRLVDRLLDVTRLQAGGVGLDVEALDLVEVVREVVERSEASGGDARIEIRGVDELPGRWDRLRVEQIVSNLVSNAVKYADGKPVIVRVGEAGDDVAISVSDQGAGISEEDRERIFQRFGRAEHGPAQPGLGLGLWITREAVRAMGGSIELDSQLGRGSTFTVTLPRRVDEAATT